MIKKNIILAILVSATFGCSQTSLPKVDYPNSFNSSESHELLQQDLAKLAWWQQLNDQTLNNLIESGLRNNNDINIAYANLEQARGQLHQVELSWIPFVNLYGGFTQNPIFANAGTFYGIWPQYILNLMQLPQQQKQAQYNVSLQRAKIDSVKITLIGQISSSYLTYIAQVEQLKLLDKLQQDMDTLIKIKSDALTGGIGVEQDIELLKSKEQQIVSQKSIVSNNIVVSQNALRYLINTNPGRITSVNDFAYMNENFINPGVLPSTVLANRPDLQIAAMQLYIANEGVNIAASNLFPQIQLDRWMGMQSSNGSVANPTTPAAFNDAYLNWQINPSTFGEIEAGKGQYKAATYNYIKTVRQILRDVDSDFSARKYYRQKFDADKSAYMHASKELNLQHNLYKQGVSAYVDVLASQLMVDNLAITQNQSKLEFMLTQVILYQDLAGGYNFESNISTP